MNQPAHIARHGLDGLLLSFLFCLSFGLHATIATELDDLGAFQKFDVLFEANPPDRHETFSHGSPNEGVTHPMLNLLIAIPIDLLEIVIGWLKGCLLYTSPSPRDS